MSYGSLLILTAAPAVIPGLGSLAAPLSGLAAVLLGCQLVLGRPEPWLPARWRARLQGLSALQRAEAKVLALAARWNLAAVPPLPRRMAGFAAAWAGFLLLLPLAFVPFSNTLPALSLAALGAGLQGARAFVSWMGLAVLGTFTAALVGLSAVLLSWMA